MHNQRQNTWKPIDTNFVHEEQWHVYILLCLLLNKDLHKKYGTDYRGALHQNSPKPQSVASPGSLHQNRQNPLSLGYLGAKFLPLPYMRVRFHFPHLDRVHAVVRQLYTHAPNCSDPSHVVKGPANHTLTLTAGLCLNIFQHFNSFYIVTAQ